LCQQQETATLTVDDELLNSKMNQCPVYQDEFWEWMNKRGVMDLG